MNNSGTHQTASGQPHTGAVIRDAYGNTIAADGPYKRQVVYPVNQSPK